VAPWQILIVDDDPSAALITQHGLQAMLGEDVRVLVAASPDEAWLACAEGKVDLLIVDPTPRSSTAAALLRACRAYRPQIPILVLTAYDTPGLRARMQGLAIDLYVPKPVDLRELAPQIRRELRMAPRPAGRRRALPCTAHS
jgi:two-component system OmpR family response regulator